MINIKNFGTFKTVTAHKSYLPACENNQKVLSDPNLRKHCRNVKKWFKYNWTVSIGKAQTTFEGTDGGTIDDAYPMYIHVVYENDNGDMVHEQFEASNTTDIFNVASGTFLNTDKNISDWEINLNNTQKKKVLLLTGSINYNTSFLKNILNNNNNIELVHKVLFNNETYLFQKDLEYIILDNFFVSDSQTNLINNLYSLDIPILFFEGINSNPNDIKTLVNLFYEEDFYLKESIKKKDILIDQLNIASINSNFSFFLKKFLTICLICDTLVL